MSKALLTATNQLPRLTLVGAGPGDPELITLKGMRALQEADIVLYDALANEELLKYVRPDVPRIYVGKRGGGKYKSQEEINELIVHCARYYGHVVRLKGGDPYIFGRGHEEQTYAESYDIVVSVVPGISSVYSVPALQSIPLTRRGVSESFWVITGTTRQGSLSQDVALAAQSTATVVILMGMRQLTKIQSVFETHGQCETPVAVIQNGSLPEEKIGVATVSTMVEMAKEEELGAPAIIVIGEVVREHKVPFWLKKAVQYA
ncbi:MAG: uroporphyrinogen-III C-methyltransferase [Bacteroidota bacterium]